MPHRLAAEHFSDISYLSSMKVYFIPGLGFDHRIFESLELGGAKKQYLNWIEPLAKEPIGVYAMRMAEAIQGKGPIALVGHSLGGVIAQEIAARRPVEKVALVSSISSRSEMPGKFKLVKPCGLHRLFTRGLATKTVGMWGRWHGYETPEYRELFKDMVRQQSNHYLQWALAALSTWHSPTSSPSPPPFQIHGARDRTFPLKHLHNPSHILPEGDHFMVYKDPAPVSEALRKHLKL